MKTYTIIPLALASLSLPASAALVTVPNFDFESDGTADGSINGSDPLNWVDSGTSGGTFNPNAAQGHYTGMGNADPNGGVLANMSGPTFGFLFAGDGASANMSQTIATTLDANTSYTLTVAIGQRNNFNAAQVPSDFMLTLETATTNTIIASFTGDVLNTNASTPGENNTGTITLTESTFTDFSANAATGAAPVGLGENLVIRITALDDGRYLDFDNVRLDATAVPEPSSVALLGLGGLALILRRRK